jgi:hypothetical protein
LDESTNRGAATIVTAVLRHPATPNGDQSKEDGWTMLVVSDVPFDLNISLPDKNYEKN